MGSAAVEFVDAGEQKRVIDRSQLRIREALADELQQRRRLGQHAALSHQRRHAPLRVEPQIVWRALLLLAEVNPNHLVRGTSVFKRQVRGQGTGAVCVVKGKHAA